MNEHLERIKEVTEPLRQQIINHQVYSAIKDIDDLKVFMQYHIFAVWDFMSLLKALQNSLTCTSVPWFPKGSADTRYLINEIVAGEESDVDSLGNRKSHFELYLDAMHQCGADSSQIEKFISLLKNTGNFDSAFTASGTPKEARERHIAVDGDHHSHLSLQMTSNLCGNNEQSWKEAEQATIESLQKRIDLWDGAHRQIKNRKITVNSELEQCRP